MTGRRVKQVEPVQGRHGPMYQRDGDNYRSHDERHHPADRRVADRPMYIGTRDTATIVFARGADRVLCLEGRKG